MTNSLLLIPSVRKQGGLGHLVRCMRLAEDYKGKAGLYIEPGPTESVWSTEEIRGFFPSFPWDDFLVKDPTSREWTWAVLDRRSTTLSEFYTLSTVSNGAATLGWDEGGEARPFCTYLVDSFPWLKRNFSPNFSDSKFVLGSNNPSTLEEVVQKVSRGKVLISFGGEDPAGLTQKTYRALVEEGGISPEEIDVLLGPANKKDFTDPCGTVFRGVRNARELFGQYTWVFTSFGLTPYEALDQGAIPVLLNPSSYHEKLGKAAGFFSIGVRNVSRKALKYFLEEPSRAIPPWSYSREGSNGSSRSVADFLASLVPDIPSCCPVCATYGNETTYRFPDRTFFRCKTCGMEYRVVFNRNDIRYTEAYFLDEYRAQYGKSYLEDFPAIQLQGAQRLKVLRELSGTLEGKTILDIGCAYGPFLQAAREEKMKPFGIDLCKEAIQYVQQELQIPALEGDILQLDPEEAFGIDRFDVITLWYVIEHIPFVDDLLKKLYTVLKPGGWLLFSTPNAKGVTGRFFPDRFYQSSPKDHLTLWNPGLTGKVLTRYGFQVRKIRMPNSHPERFPRCLQRLLGIHGCTFLESLCKWGDTFEVYAQKIDSHFRC